MALAVGALLAVNVSAASAVTWNPNPTGGYVTAPSGFTVYKNGGSPTTCTIAGKGWNGAFFGSSVGFEPTSGASCAGGTNFGWQLQATAVSVEGGFQVNPFLSGSKTQVSPWGYYQQCYGCGGQPLPIGTWKNGSGATPSTWTFNKQPISSGVGGVISISGTFNVTTLTGGLLTLK